jgi:hypothetical protein
MKMRTSVLVLCAAFTLAGCGLTLDKVKQAASDAIDAGGKIYETITGEGSAASTDSKDVTKPSEQK